MSFTHALPPACRRAALITVVLWTVTPGVQAQQGGGDGSADRVLVLARTVQPRIAYRGIPLEDHPVHTQATVFPGSVFQRTLDASMERLVGDAELVQLGSLGVERGVGPSFTAGRLGMADTGLFAGGGAGAATPLRSGAGAGGAVSAAINGLGSLLQGSVLPVPATNPGGGP